MRRKKQNKDIVIITKYNYVIISSFFLADEQLTEIDEIINEEFKIGENIENHLDVIAIRIAKPFTINNLQIKVQKILKWENEVKLLITMTDDLYRDDIINI